MSILPAVTLTIEGDRGQKRVGLGRPTFLPALICTMEGQRGQNACGYAQAARPSSALSTRSG